MKNANFNSLEKAIIRASARSHGLRVTLTNTGFSGGSGAWRISKHANRILCQLWDGDSLIESYASRTPVGLSRNLNFKLWNQL